jgi:predicted alpha/beta hydrolase family esterase
MIALPDLSSYRVLVVPGLHGSGDAHWQTRWEQLYPQFERVQQDDWETPDLPRWSQRMVQVLQQSDKPVFVVAHSFGCLTTMHAASHDRFNLAGALLVAPADPERFSVADVLRDARLPCPAIVIGSSNDPWMASQRAAYWADRWSCGFLNAGALGHINAESQLGDWEQGLQQLKQLIEMAHAFAPAALQLA